MIAWQANYRENIRSCAAIVTGQAVIFIYPEPQQPFSARRPMYLMTGQTGIVGKAGKFRPILWVYQSISNVTLTVGVGSKVPAQHFVTGGAKHAPPQWQPKKVTQFVIVWVMASGTIDLAMRAKAQLAAYHLSVAQLGIDVTQCPVISKTNRMII